MEGGGRGQRSGDVGNTRWDEAVQIWTSVGLSGRVGTCIRCVMGSNGVVGAGGFKAGAEPGRVSIDRTATS